MNAAITNTASSIKAIKMIFNWQSREGLHCHCLLRIYIKQNLGRAVIIASELYSNRENTSLTHDLKGLASAIVHSLRTEISVPLSQVTWIVHYGDFSQPHSYENLSFPDEFSLVNLPGNGNELGEGEGEWIVMSSAQIQELLGSINLEPIARLVTSFTNSDSNVVVVGGRGFVGCGVIRFLEQEGITCFTLDIGDDLLRTLEGDIVVSATGQPELLDERHLRPYHRLVVDTGFIPFSNNIIFGDVKRSAYQIPQNITPVPGGVGPLQMATLLERLIEVVTSRSLEKWVYPRSNYELRMDIEP